MPPFWLGFGAAATLTMFACGLQVRYLGDLEAHLPFVAACVVVFALLGVAIYASAKTAAASDNPARLAQYVLALTIAKMAVGLALVFGYYLYARPAGRAFLLPFFTAYLAFTVWETVWLLRLNRAAALRSRGLRERPTR